MMDLEYSFEETPWELYLHNLRTGGTLSAAKFLTLLEGEQDEAVEDAFSDLQERQVLLDLSDLPDPVAAGDTAIRLRLEEKLVAEGRLLQGLEEGDPLGLYLQEVAMIPACGDPQVLVQKCKEGNEAAMTQLTNGMLSLVIELACAHVGKGVLLLDLIQEGSLGLWQSILDYDTGEFLPWCRRHIQMAMAKIITLQARAGGVGQKMRQAMEDFRMADKRLLTQLGRNPTLEEIAVELRMTPETAAIVEEMLDSARMMDRTKQASEAAEKTPEDEQAVEDTAYFQMRQRISELLSGLTELDAKLLSLRFGLEGGLPMSPGDVGRQLGLTADEVTKREAAALAMLRTQR